jgi:hypothetical protein
MKLLEIIKRVSRVLDKERCHYCLIGGHAASLYRSQERFTKDVDFAVLASSVSTSSKIAQKAISRLGLKPIIAFIPRAGNEKQRKSVCMITSAPTKGELKGIVDILLPDLPWVKSAVERAQFNMIDLGFAKVPVITPEDLVIAKAYALNNAPDRFMDLDDIKEIFENVLDLDFDYLRETLRELGIVMPSQVKKYYTKRMK